mgnify:FL=1
MNSGQGKNNGKPRLVLASASPRRRELLAGLNLPFLVHPSRAEEAAVALPEDPQDRVRYLALCKAREVANIYPDHVVLGVDTVVALDGRILEKPADSEEAVRMLQALSGKWHQVYSGLALVHRSTGQERQGVVQTAVHFLPLGEEEIRAYVATGEPMDKAGAYGIQGRAAVFIDESRGCYFNVVGLPLAALAQLLREFGMEILKE